MKTCVNYNISIYKICKYLNLYIVLLIILIPLLHYFGGYDGWSILALSDIFIVPSLLIPILDFLLICVLFMFKKEKIKLLNLLFPIVAGMFFYFPQFGFQFIQLSLESTGIKSRVESTCGIRKLQYWSEKQFSSPVHQIAEKVSIHGAALPHPPEYWLNRKLIPMYIRKLVTQSYDSPFTINKIDNFKYINILVCDIKYHTFGVVIFNNNSHNNITKWKNYENMSITTNQIGPDMYTWQINYDTTFL